MIENLKRIYILKKVFNHIQKFKSLDIIKYNKKIQQKLNLNINDYKKHSEIYSTVEIEIAPIKNKYGKFININKNEQLYFHIYFNNNKEEITRSFLNKEDEVTKINIKINYHINSFLELFYNCDCIESIQFKKIVRNNFTNMSEMFMGCSSLKEINFSNFNTVNITNMNKLFYRCSSLKEINLSNFNIDNLIDMK